MSVDSDKAKIALQIAAGITTAAAVVFVGHRVITEIAKVKSNNLLR
jgi:hypothetical protein